MGVVEPNKTTSKDGGHLGLLVEQNQILSILL
jgi:hypothetical protein